MGVVKKIAIGFGITVIAFFVIVIAVGVTVIQELEEQGEFVSEPTTSIPITIAPETSEPIAGESDIYESFESIQESTQEKVFGASVSELLPTRNEVGTVWKMKDPEPLTSEASGFVEGIKLDLIKGGQFDITLLSVYVREFDSTVDARNYYDNFISEQKQKGGYKEWSPKGVGADSCYGRDASLTTADKITAYCIKGNYQFSAAMLGFEYDMKGKTTNYVKIIANKILSGYTT